MPEPLVAVPLPHMGVSVDEATVVAWHKSVGEAVRADEALCDISTDKVDTEIASPCDGVLARIVAEVGETVAVGATLAELAVGADISAPAPSPVPVASGAPRFDPVAAAASVIDRAGNGSGRPISSP